jgi:hypothetical protein
MHFDQTGGPVMKQNTIIHILLGVAVAGAIGLGYFLLRPYGGEGLSVSGWLLFAGVALVLIAAAFGPSLVGRMRGAPAPAVLSAADLRLCVLLVVVGSGLAVVGVFSGMWWLMTLGIMLAPLTFAFRGARVQRDDLRH